MAFLNLAKLINFAKFKNTYAYKNRKLTNAFLLH